jgi:tetratricopeptide (TPR) repeat protein
MTAPLDQLRDAIRAHQAGDLPQAVALADSALRALERDGDHRGAASALHVLAGIALQRDAAHEAVEFLEHALGLWEAHRDAEGQAAVRRDLVAARVRLRDTAGALDDARKALALHRGLGQDARVLASLHQVAELLADAGQLDEAESTCSEGLGLAGASHVHARAALTVVGSRIALARQDVALARERADQALALAQSTDSTSLLGDALHHSASVHLAEGSLEIAERQLEAAVDARIKAGDAAGHAAALQELAAVEAALGRTGATVEHLRDAAALYHHLARAPELLEVLTALAAAQAGAGDLAASLDSGAQAIELAKELDPGLARRAWTNQAERRIQAGDIDGAIVDLRAAAELTEGEVVDRGVARAMLGQLLGAVGRVDEAVIELRGARQMLGASDEGAASEIDEILAELGAP